MGVLLSRLGSARRASGTGSGNPVDLFLYGTLLEEPAPLQDGLAVLNHVGMAAEIRQRIARLQFPMVGVFSQDVIGATDFSRPVGVVPRAAHGWHVPEPRQFFLQSSQLLAVPEFPRAAGTVQQI